MVALSDLLTLEEIDSLETRPVRSSGQVTVGQDFENTAAKVVTLDNGQALVLTDTPDDEDE